jgi:hypothetical protein
MSKHNPVAKAINYMLDGTGRWDVFTAFLDDGHLGLTNNAAERALRDIALNCSYAHQVIMRSSLRRRLQVPPRW